MKLKFLTYFLIAVSVTAFAQNTEASRRDTIQFGTETEIAALIQSLRTENVDYLDDELAALIETTRNQRILSGVFGFFGEREKSGLEGRAMRAITERDDEANETVQSAVDYLGKVRAAQAVPVIIELLDNEERRFYNTGFRALGRAASADEKTADEAADFLLDFYENRDPGDDNRRELIAAIGETGSKNGVPFLIEIVSNTDGRIPLRVAALEALSKIGDSDGIDAVLACVTTNDPNVRSAAVAALGPFSGEAVDKAILDAFRDSFYRTRIAATQASRERKLEAAVPYLKFRAERDDVPNVKDEAIRALGAIANAEAIEALESLFMEKRNSDRVRILAAEMLLKNDGGKNFNRLAAELEEARTRNFTGLYNGFLRVAGESVITGDKTEMENLVRRLFLSNNVIEKMYALDMSANNGLRNFSGEIIKLAGDRNESVARRARQAAEKLNISINNE